MISALDLKFGDPRFKAHDLYFQLGAGHKHIDNHIDDGFMFHIYV